MPACTLRRPGVAADAVMDALRSPARERHEFKDFCASFTSSTGHATLAEACCLWQGSLTAETPGPISLHLSSKHATTPWSPGDQSGVLTEYSSSRQRVPKAQRVDGRLVHCAQELANSGMQLWAPQQCNQRQRRGCNLIGVEVHSTGSTFARLRRPITAPNHRHPLCGIRPPAINTAQGSAHRQGSSVQPCSCQNALALAAPQLHGPVPASLRTLRVATPPVPVTGASPCGAAGPVWDCCPSTSTAPKPCAAPTGPRGAGPRPAMHAQAVPGTLLVPSQPMGAR